MDRIPDLVLKALFRQMTPADQIVARKVCSRWSVLVPEAARSVRFLALVVGEECKWCVVLSGNELIMLNSIGQLKENVNRWKVLKVVSTTAHMAHTGA